MTKFPAAFRYAAMARTLSIHERPMGAAITRHGKLLSIGCNINKTHPQFPDLYSIHAEIKAILAAQMDLDYSAIWVYREVWDDVRGIYRPAMAKPCQECMKLILASGITKIYYTTNEFPNWEMLKI